MSVFEEARYQFRLRRLQREKRRLRAFYAAENKALEARWRDAGTAPEKRLQEAQDLTYLELHEVMIVDEKISRLETTYLLEQAERYLLPRPPFKTDTEDASWEQASLSAQYHLKDAALVALRSAIRRERKEREERWKSWIPLLIGFAGTIIGIISVWKK
jgi:hypothetical protein